MVLPSISFILPLVIALNVTVSDGMTGGEILALLAIPFFLANIPTILPAAVYLACREKVGRKKQLDKMSIQDLE